MYNLPTVTEFQRKEYFCVKFGKEPVSMRMYNVVMPRTSLHNAGMKPVEVKSFMFIFNVNTLKVIG